MYAVPLLLQDCKLGVIHVNSDVQALATTLRSLDWEYVDDPRAHHPRLLRVNSRYHVKWGQLRPEGPRWKTASEWLQATERNKWGLPVGNQGLVSFQGTDAYTSLGIGGQYPHKYEPGTTHESPAIDISETGECPVWKVLVSLIDDKQIPDVVPEIKGSPDFYEALAEGLLVLDARLCNEKNMKPMDWPNPDPNQSTEMEGEIGGSVK